MQNQYYTIFMSREVKLQALFFLLLWPTLNISVVSLLLSSFDKLTLDSMSFVISRVGLMFATAFMVTLVTHWIYVQKKWPVEYSKFLVLQGALVVLTLIILKPLPRIPGLPEIPQTPAGALAILILEVVVYITVMLLIKRQEQHLKARISMQQLELNSLRMQTNPHFLFNTLNLIAYEIDDTNLKAKALIFDLSDMLQQNIKLAQKDVVELKEELEWVALYLTLQKKRYEDRLTFDIDYTDEVESSLVPSLFLLPVIENAIKYGVEPYTDKAHISVLVDIEQGSLLFQIIDSGAQFEADKINQGNGLRILHETLRLHYGNQYTAELVSEADGNAMTITIPAKRCVVCAE